MELIDIFELLSYKPFFILIYFYDIIVNDCGAIVIPSEARDAFCEAEPRLTK